MEIFSTRDLLSNLINDIHLKGIFHGKDRNEIQNHIRNKFIVELEIFIENGFFADGFKIENLEGNTYEVRIKLPQKFLLRVIFYFEYGKIILNTGFIVKEDKGSYDKKTKINIENAYKKEIEKSLTIFESFNKCNDDFICLDKFFNF